MTSTIDNTIVFPASVADAKLCMECGNESDTCGWANNDKETYFTYCCADCDVDGENYNDWAKRKSNLSSFLRPVKALTRSSLKIFLVDDLKKSIKNVVDRGEFGTTDALARIPDQIHDLSYDEYYGRYTNYYIKDLTRKEAEDIVIAWHIRVGEVNAKTRELQRKEDADLKAHNDNAEKIRRAEITERYEAMEKEALPFNQVEWARNKRQCDDHMLSYYEQILKIRKQFLEADVEERRVILKAVAIANHNLTQNTEGENVLMMMISFLPTDKMEECFNGLFKSDGSVYWFHCDKTWEIAMGHARSGKGRYGREY